MSAPSNSPIAFSANGVTQTQGPFRLTAGKFQFAAIAPTGQTSTLQQLGPDAATYVAVATVPPGNGVTSADLPDGMYQVSFTTSALTASISIVRIGGGGTN